MLQRFSFILALIFTITATVCGTQRSTGNGFVLSAFSSLVVKQVSNTLVKSSNPPKNKRFVLVKKGPAPVRAELTPESPILGMAHRGRHYQLVNAGHSWCTIIFNDKEGWIERQNVEIVKKKAPTIVLNEFLMFFGIILLVLIAIAGIYYFSNRKSKVDDDWFDTTNKTKKILIISTVDTQVQRYFTNTSIPLEKCFAEVGFDVKTATNSSDSMKQVYHYLPDALIVDWQMGANTQAIIEQILGSKSTVNNTFVLFYNVNDPSTVQKSQIILNAHYLGFSFTDRDLFDIITPLLITGDAPQNITKSVEASALQGNIGSGNLSEVLQFIEIGRKTGCLLIEKDKPCGIIYFNDGIIIYAAAAKQTTGKKAVIELLNLQSGKFNFIVDKKPKSSNCTLPTLGVLMEWTKEADESSGNRLR